VLFKKDKMLKTPLLVTIGAVFIGWLHVAALASQFELRHRGDMHDTPLLWSIGVAVSVVGCGLVVAYWNMKRWAALGLLSLALFSIAATSHLATHPVTIAMLRLLPLAPAAVYWRRFTWA
jgi:hypothetical protein